MHGHERVNTTSEREERRFDEASLRQSPQQQQQQQRPLPPRRDFDADAINYNYKNNFNPQRPPSPALPNESSPQQRQQRRFVGDGVAAASAATPGTPEGRVGNLQELRRQRNNNINDNNTKGIPASLTPQQSAPKEGLMSVERICPRVPLSIAPKNRSVPSDQELVSFIQREHRDYFNKLKVNYQSFQNGETYRLAEAPLNNPTNINSNNNSGSNINVNNNNVNNKPLCPTQGFCSLLQSDPSHKFQFMHRCINSSQNCKTYNSPNAETRRKHIELFLHQ